MEITNWLMVMWLGGISFSLASIANTLKEIKNELSKSSTTR